MELHIPKEPKEMLARLKHIRADMGTGSIDWDSYVVWHANQLPQYLWSEWKDELKAGGFTWQKFLRLLRMRTDIFIGWLKGMYPWSRLAQDVVTLLESPLGRDVAKR